MSNNLLSAAVRSVLLTSAVAAAGFPATVLATEAELEEVVVTGSLIPQDLNAPGVPVTLVSSADISASGVGGDLLDVLGKTQPFFYGGLNIGSENGNTSSGSTNGGSQIALRNRSTLVLINGRRAAVSPVAASGGYNFVDLNLIPVSAVERVEILADGASATYGADAVGGVVNMILKTDYEGFEVGGRYGADKWNEYSERTYYATMGASNEATSVTFSLEFKKNDPVFQKDRSWGKGIYRTPTYAGVVSFGSPAEYYYLNPTLNAPPTGLNLSPEELIAQGIYQGPYDQGGATQFFDLSEKPTMIIAKESKSAVLAFDHKINERHTLFGDFMVSNTDTWSQLNAQPVSGSVAASNPNNPFNRTVTARNRFVELPREYNTVTTGWRGVLGFKGDLVGSWKYEIAGDWNYTSSDYTNKGLIDAIAYEKAVLCEEEGIPCLNPFARQQAPGVLESFAGTAFANYKSSLYAYDVKVYGDLFDLPAGAVRLAVGADTREESLAYDNDRNEQMGLWLQGTPTLPFNGKLQSQGYYAEVRIPVFSPDFNIPGFYALDLSIAGRQEVYSTTDDPFVPKVTLRWQPFGETFAVRGTYSESFTAPTLYELIGPTSAGFTSGLVLQRYNSNGTPMGVATAQSQYRIMSGSNPDLEPTTSKNWSIGFDWIPTGALDGFRASLDYWSISEEDIVNGLPEGDVLQSVEALGADSPYAQYVRIAESVAGELHFHDGAPITAPGQITSANSDAVWFTSSLTNIAGIDQEGIDLRLSYAYDTESWGTFSGALAGTYLLKYDQQLLPTDPVVDLSGVYNDDYGNFPKYRAFLQLGWKYGPWVAGINGTYIPSVEDVTYGKDENGRNYSPDVDSYMSWDVRVGYNFGETSSLAKGLAVTFGINNVFDEQPPYVDSEANQSRDIGTYDPIGTLYYAEVSYKF